MSTSNMAASWRQANDVIAPGWLEGLECYKAYDIEKLTTKLKSDNVEYINKM